MNVSLIAKNMQYKKRWLQVLLMLMLSSVAITSCRQPDVENPVEKDTYLIEARFVGEYTSQQVQARYGGVNPMVQLLARYPVKVYSLTYKTHDFNNREVTASGAVLVPVRSDGMPVLGMQHGTIQSDDLAPSHYKENSEAYMFGTLASSAGYMVVAPDYLGYGASKDMPHPYEHAPTLASASRDMLRAAREFAKKEELHVSNKLFLAGYSEGGYATMALHKLLEEHHSEEFAVTASAPGAGAYDKTTFAKSILNSSEPLNFINAYLWVLDTYNREYKLNRPWTFYLNEPYASHVQSKGPLTTVNNTPTELFNTSFKGGVINGVDLETLQTFSDNDVYDWKPVAPVLLAHGVDDDFVPFFNSQRAYDAMKARGAERVELRELSGDHFTASPGYLQAVFLYFSNF
jgi:pimeloyl-ACP methyl ester carboxylesterase